MAGTPTPERALAATEQACSAIAQALSGLQLLLAALEHDQTITADSRAGDAAKVLDRPAQVGALLAMEHLLRDGDMEAMSVAGQLQKQFEGALGAEIEALNATMADLEFAQALPL